MIPSLGIVVTAKPRPGSQFENSRLFSTDPIASGEALNPSSSRHLRSSCARVHQETFILTTVNNRSGQGPPETFVDSQYGVPLCVLVIKWL